MCMFELETSEAHADIPCDEATFFIRLLLDAHSLFHRELLYRWNVEWIGPP